MHLILVINSYPHGQNEGKNTEGNFKSKFVNENWLILIILSLKSIPWGVIDKKTSLI